jgi:hypothetical protein
MDKIRNKTVATKMEVTEDILQEIAEQQLKWCGHVMRMEGCIIAKQIVECNPQANKRHAAHQSAYGRMKLGRACKAETSRIKNVRSRALEGKNVFRLRKNVYSQTNS